MAHHNQCVQAVEVRDLPSEYDLDTLYCDVGLCNEHGTMWEEDPERHKYGGVILSLIIYNVILYLTFSCYSLFPGILIY
jgi:hypothetical protein